MIQYGLTYLRYVRSVLELTPDPHVTSIHIRFDLKFSTAFSLAT